MNQQKIENLLRKKIGLEAVSIGSNTIARVIHRRMEACGTREIETYFNLLQTSPEELEQLIEEAIVPETWFFRDRGPFVFLSQYVSSQWLLNNRGKMLRVLSVPCATGEEPYSIAIALMEAGLSCKNFTIDAVDISQKSLLKAKQGIYRQNSFRGMEQDFLKRYFTQIGNEYHLSDAVIRTVNFLQGNLLDPYFLIDKFAYDIIFCRNVLIYFDRAAIETTNIVLDRLLEPQGLLFVGHAETGQISSLRFEPVRYSFAFAFRKLQQEEKTKKRKEAVPLKPAAPKAIEAKKLPASEHFNLKTSGNIRDISPIAAQTTPNSPSNFPDLGAARRLADLGQLEAATALCETFLSQNRVSVEAYVLLGQVHQAAGKKEQAEQYFQRAIYLEPNCYEALIHLALLKESRGDIAGGAIIRQRIERLQKG